MIILLLIAIGLSMDAFAVSISFGTQKRTNHFETALLLACVFGGFQAMMPALGFFLGKYLSTWLSGFDHWIAFILLSLIGLKMIQDFLAPESDDSPHTNLTFLTLTSLGIATSIDAFAVGITFAFVKISLLWGVIVIGITTFLFSLIGVYFGKKLSHIFGKKMELVGGLILIGIGLKILLEHILGGI